MTIVPLYPCDHRGNEVQTPRRVKHECSHPKVARRTLPSPKLVTASACNECKYSRWDVPAALATYVQERPAQLTMDEYATRLAICDTCEFRDGNYCTRHDANCALSARCRRSAFECPAHKFEAMQR
jgi:hypothetical protein